MANHSKENAHCLALYIKEEDFQQLKKEANSLGLSVSMYMRVLIKNRKKVEINIK